MAKQNGSPFPVFEIPTNALVKAAPKEGSRAWMRKTALDHGDTDEKKLEKRRKGLTAFLVSMDDHIEKLQQKKKLFLLDSKKYSAENVKREKEILAAIAEAEPKSEEVSKLQQQLSSVLAIREQQTIAFGQQETQFEIMLDQKMYQRAMLESQCLCVDMMSIQVRGVKSKGGKKGTIRASMAAYTMDAAVEAARIYRRVRKVTDALCTQFKLVLPDDDPEDYGEDEDEEYEDEEVVDDTDLKNIKKEAGGSDDDEFTG